MDTDIDCASDNDRIIGDYLDAMFITPMPIHSLTPGFELVRTIPLQAIITGQQRSSQYECVMILLMTLRLLRQLSHHSRVYDSVLSVASEMVLLLQVSARK